MIHDTPRGVRATSFLLTSSILAIAAANWAISGSSEIPPNRLDWTWNRTFPGYDNLVGMEFGWGKIYVTLSGNQAEFLDAATGHSLGEGTAPSQGCFIWTSTTIVMPLPGPPDTAVMAGGNRVLEFTGTDGFKNETWISSRFDCPYLQSVSTQAITVTNFTTFGVVSTKDGSMWTVNYATYETHGDVDGNIYLIEPDPASLVVLVVSWPSFSSGATNNTLYDGYTGKVIWEKSSDAVNFFKYSPVTQLLYEYNPPNVLQARDWKNWDASPVWTASVLLSKFNYQGIVFTDTLIFLFDGDNGGVGTVDAHTGSQGWRVNSTAAASAKLVRVSATEKFWYLTYSKGSGDYMAVDIEKRSILDGSLIWSKDSGARVQYGWFDTTVSSDESLLYLWPRTQGAWLAAYPTN
eukprot:m.222465 g.222465  ORF g.222465 m.222465 type:complete len:406 (-) comp15625_c0_seq3:2568-3785(-)